MADGKIYITISDTRGGSNGGEQLNSSSNPSSVVQTAQSKKGTSDITKILALKAFDTAIGIANQAASYSIGNIGNFTGNYQQQRDIQSNLTIVNTVVGYGETAVSGFMMGGGGISGAIVAAVMVTAKAGTDLFNKFLEIQADQINNRKINRNIEFMRNRLGLEGLTNGSRSGGY